MDYQTGWGDMKRWLKQGIEYLSKREEELSQEGRSVNEHIRVKGKLDGLKTSLHHMEETERISE